MGQDDYREQVTLAWSDLNAAQQQIAKQVVFDSVGYEPLPMQAPAHESDAQVIILTGGEGSGKSITTSAEIMARYPTWRRVLFAAYKAESAGNESDYLYGFLNKIGAVKQYRKPKSGAIELITRDGAVVESVSTYAEGERAVSGTGKNYDVIAMLEAGKQKYSVFLACLLRISRTGGLLILSGTIERSEPWFPDLLRKLKDDEKRRAEMNAQIVVMPTWENRLMYPGGREDPKVVMLEKELGTDLFLERLGGEPTPPEGLVLRGFSFLTHVFDWVTYDPKYPVFVAIDPGYSGSHYSVNFIQEHTRAYTRQFYADLPDASLTDVWVIGDLYLNYTTHEEVIALSKELEWWSHIQGGVGDVVMKTHPMADRAPVDVWKEKGGIWLRGQPVGIQDGIDRHRTFLIDPATKYPRIFFNPSCQGIVEYGLWKKRLIGENLYGPPEDKNCDFTKAIQYYLIDRFGRVEHQSTSKVVVGGQRVTLDKAQTQMPATVGLPHPQIQQPMLRKSSMFVSGPRTKRKVPL